jgi:hypothetical protein
MTTSNGVNNEMDSIIPEGGTQDAPKAETPAKIKPAAKPVKRAKPLVEGINAPKSTQDIIMVKANLSQKEKELISETADSKPDSGVVPNLSPNIEQNMPEVRLMPESVSQSMNKKNHHIGRWLLIFVVLLILVAGTYEFYVWRLSDGQEPIVGHYHPAAFDASQPFPLAGESPSTSPSSTPITVATTTPTSTPIAVLQIKINPTPTGFLNVRDIPSSSGKILTQVKPGEVYIYTKVQNNWYQITFSGFNQGWVSGQYVTKQ